MADDEQPRQSSMFEDRLVALRAERMDLALRLSHADKVLRAVKTFRDNPLDHRAAEELRTAYTKYEGWCFNVAMHELAMTWEKQVRCNTDLAQATVEQWAQPALDRALDARDEAQSDWYRSFDAMWPEIYAFFMATDVSSPRPQP
jgi:hypothetical protein